MKKKPRILSADDYIRSVTESANGFAEFVIEDAKRYVRLHREYTLAMSALRLFKEHLGMVQEFDEIWDEWKDKPIKFHFDVYPNEDKTKMIVTFIDDEEKKND